MNGHVIENNDNIVQTQSIMGRPSNPPWSHLNFSGSWDNCLNCPASARIISSFDNSLCIFQTKVSRTTKFCSYFGFYSLYNTWKDQLYRISGSEFYEWLFGPEKFRDFRESYLIERLSPRKKRGNKACQSSAVPGPFLVRDLWFLSFVSIFRLIHP